MLGQYGAQLRKTLVRRNETLARTIVGNEQTPERKAQLIERYMVRNFRYVANDEAAESVLTAEHQTAEPVDATRRETTTLAGPARAVASPRPLVVGQLGTGHDGDATVE